MQESEWASNPSPPYQGLSYLHALSITHGDLKPANVLLKSSRLDRRGFTTRISDFGFASVNGRGESRGIGSMGGLSHVALGQWVG